MLLCGGVRRQCHRRRPRTRRYVGQVGPDHGASGCLLPPSRHLVPLPPYRHLNGGGKWCDRQRVRMSRTALPPFFPLPPFSHCHHFSLPSPACPLPSRWWSCLSPDGGPLPLELLAAEPKPLSRRGSPSLRGGRVGH